MHIRGSLVFTLTVLLGIASLVPAQAERPLLDTHKLDGVFALYARDVQVPWKRVSVRLDTYSGAPVDFAAYEVDPADVLIAGSPRMHAIDTAHVRPVVRWKFTPPPGFRFESNDVEVPLHGKEGFFVIEARRGDATQQTWINLTRVGLVSKETPEGWLLYGTDLGTGRPLQGMRVTLLVGRRFVVEKTGRDGILQGIPGARFALAQWGRSEAFISLAPQPPLPRGIVGVRVDRGVVRAGQVLRIVGFARARDGKILRPMHGDVHVTALIKGKQIAGADFPLGDSGGFAGDLTIPSSTPAGELSVLASAQGTTGGTSVHVDAAGNYTLRIAALCEPACAAASPVPMRISLETHGTGVAGAAITVHVVRTPHVIPPGAGDVARWGTTTIVNTSLRTGPDGTASLTLPPPTDGLSSTYGVVASTQSATATTQIVAPNAQTVVSITPRANQINVGEPAVFDVRAFNAVDGKPAAGRNVTVRFTRGANVDQQTVRLDSAGWGQAIFHEAEPGTDLVMAQLTDDRAALDATAVTVAPSALGASVLSRSTDIAIKLDKPRYKLTDRVHVEAGLTGAAGDALFTVEGARVAETRVVGVSGGRASATLSLEKAAGAVRIGVAFVRDGAVYTSDVPVEIDGPGYPRATSLVPDREAYTPGATAHIAIHDGSDTKGALLAIRVSNGRPSGGASFAGAPELLAAGGTTTQDPASPDPSWHAYVAPAGSKARDIFSFGPPERVHSVQPIDDSLAISAPSALEWRIQHADGNAFDVALPTQRGHYIVSVLKISDDGDVGAASVGVSVQ